MSLISIYSKTTNSRITTPALALRLLTLDAITTTDISTTIHNGSTMTGNSR